MSAHSILPTDPDELKRVQAAWAPLLAQIPEGCALEIGKLEKGETLTEFRFGEHHGHPVLYRTIITASQETAISVGTIEDSPCLSTLTLSFPASRLAP